MTGNVFCLIYLSTYLSVCLSVYVSISLSSSCPSVSYPSLTLSLSSPLFEFLSAMLSVAPITGECPNHFTLMKDHRVDACRHKTALHLIQYAHVLPHCEFSLCFSVSGFKRGYTFVLLFHWPFFFFFRGLANIYSTFECLSVCLQEIGAWQSVFDFLLELLMMTFLFVYQDFPTFSLPTMTLI